MDVKDFLGEENTLGIDIWDKKYRFDGESFDEFLERITNGNEEVKKLIVEKKFLYAGRVLANRGLYKHGIKVTYSNCYTTDRPDDNLESIYKIDYNLAKTFAYGGGQGVDISNLSPKGARIRNAAKTTSGAVSFMDQFARTCARISQNGRRGALMIMMDCNHPDIEEFISIKGDLDKIVSANISVRIDDEFMKKVENDLPHTLRFERKETGEVIEKVVNAKQLFWRLAKMNWRTAEPGILYWDRINSWTLLSEHDNFEFAATNPCAEQPLPANGSCILSSLNLGAFVLDPFTTNARFDFDSFEKAVDVVTREMNVILDEGLPLHPLQEQRDSVAKWRQIGTGIMGLADMYIKMGVKYGSQTSLAIANRIGKVMVQRALLTSALLAKESGPYLGCQKEAILESPFFKKHATKEIIDLVSKHGLRNSQLLTVAPTGSISTMANFSGGLEPLFATEFIRTTKSLHGQDVSYKVYSAIVKECMDAYGVDEIPDHVVTSRNLNYKQRIKMQATWQEYIDAAISSTINLPQETTVEEVFDIYLQAWKNGLKGVTVYRSGCEREGILTVEKDEDEMRVTNDDHNCPECGSELIPVLGCFECPNCGWGKCDIQK